MASLSSIDRTTFPNGYTLGGWTLLKQIGQGTGSVRVYKAKKWGRAAAIKVRDTESPGKDRSLRTEYDIMYKVGNGERLLEVWDYRVLDGLEFYAMKQRERTFDLHWGLLQLEKNPSHRRVSCAMNLAIDMIIALKHVHSCGLVHREVSRRHILHKQGLAREQFYLTGFGFSTPFRDTHTFHIPDGTRAAFDGETLFASISAQMQCVTSRRDDLESLAYVLISLFQRLPWKNVSNKEGLRMKLDFASSTCVYRGKMVPLVLWKFLEYALHISFTAEPAYGQWCEAFRAFDLGGRLAVPIAGKPAQRPIEDPALRLHAYKY